ncbi:hypothetical protein [Dactylosporangium sp. CA-092794]|uniref:hypothetical protein n=1 Tax=Dactylosporangium sp. CA-092794 TaxID=3239929 RepID=UPI003D934E0D
MRMDVSTAGLRELSAAVGKLDTDVTVARGMVAGAAGPRDAGVAGSPQTAALYSELQNEWTAGLERLAASLGGLAAAVSAAAAAYDRAEAANAERAGGAAQGAEGGAGHGR